MDVSFNCPKCGLHISADAEAVGELINCPECDVEFRIPPGRPRQRPVPVDVKKTTGPAPSVVSAKGKTGPAGRVGSHRGLTVPHHTGPQESLLKKSDPAGKLKPDPPKIRVRCIKRSTCVEVGQDRFDEVVTEFLNQVGQANIIHMSTITYGTVDASGHMLPDYGIMVIYKRSVRRRTAPRFSRLAIFPFPPPPRTQVAP